MSDEPRTGQSRKPWTPWNKGKLTGPKPPLKVREIRAIPIRLQLANQFRDLALFNLAIDSKLRGCDLVALRVRDVAHSGTVAHRAIVLQHKTQQPVQFDLTDQTRESVAAWITHAKLRPEGFPFPSRGIFPASSSRTRHHAFAHDCSRPRAVRRTSPKVPVQVRQWIAPALALPDLVLGAQPPAQPRTGSSHARQERRPV